MSPDAPAPGPSLRLLLVEDSPDDESLLLRALEKDGLAVQHVRVQTEADMRSQLVAKEWDLVISDYSMPAFDGISAFKVLKDSGKDVPFIFVSGTLGEDVAVQAMRLGVSDYLTKGNLRRLGPAVRRELREAEERRRRREAEEALSQAGQRMREAQKMEALGRLAGGMAHDFNNVLSVVLGHLSLLEQEKGPGHSQSLDEIRHCLERAAALVRQLLALGRGQPQEHRPLSLNVVVEGAAKMFEHASGVGVTLSYALEDGLPLVLADAGQIEQVLLNLVINARDAMPNGGRIRLETRTVDLDEGQLEGEHEVQAGRFVELSVRDNGSGMSPEVMAHIFEPFYSTKPVGKGTGLGLSMAYGVLRQHQGRVTVESRPGEGTCFRLFIPVQAQAASAAPVPAVRPADLAVAGQGGWTVLLVEDELMLRELLRRTLEAGGCKVLGATDPMDALELAGANAGSLDLVITDINMPKMDGRELARRLKVLCPAARVIYMTGYAQDPQRLGEALILKPFRPAELLAKIRQAMAS